jgi:hypothetical protein
MKDLVLLPTVQHTGTWFMKNMFEHLYDEPVTLYENTFYGSSQQHLEKGILLPHIGMDGESMYQHSNGTKVKFMPEYIFNALIEKHKTVIPVRDPMLSLITRENRHSDLTHSHIIRGFSMLAKISQHPNVMFFPIDTSRRSSVRLSQLDSLEQFLGIEARSMSAKKIFVQLWEPKNEAVDSHGLKVDYLTTGSYKRVVNRMPKETELLFSNKEIKPFLINLGYSCPWFKECVA